MRKDMGNGRKGRIRENKELGEREKGERQGKKGERKMREEGEGENEV